MHRETENSRSTNTQAFRTDKPQSETARPAKTRDNQMSKGKCKNITNRNPDNLAPSEPSSPTTSPGYPNTLEKQDLDLKSYLMMLIEDFKKDIGNSLKEVQENISQQVQALKKGRILSDLQRRPKTNTLQTIPQNRNRRNTI